MNTDEHRFRGRASFGSRLLGSLMGDDPVRRPQRDACRLVGVHLCSSVVSIEWIRLRQVSPLIVRYRLVDRRGPRWNIAGEFSGGPLSVPHWQRSKA